MFLYYLYDSLTYEGLVTLAKYYVPSKLVIPVWHVANDLIGNGIFALYRVIDIYNVICVDCYIYFKYQL